MNPPYLCNHSYMQMYYHTFLMQHLFQDFRSDIYSKLSHYYLLTPDNVHISVETPVYNAVSFPHIPMHYSFLHLFP